MIDSGPLSLAGRLAILGWIVAVGAGFLLWCVADATPGASGPATPTSAETHGKPSVVLFVHPHCPCTRAALPDFVAVAGSSSADVQVVFVCPSGVSDGWERTRSWQIVTAAPGLTALVDRDGRAAAAGARTSGYAVARDASGQLVFRGGIGRGRVEPNPGLRAIAEVLVGRKPDMRDVPVFGCPLVAPE